MRRVSGERSAKARATGAAATVPAVFPLTISVRFLARARPARALRATRGGLSPEESREPASSSGQSPHLEADIGVEEVPKELAADRPPGEKRLRSRLPSSVEERP